MGCHRARQYGRMPSIKVCVRARACNRKRENVLCHSQHCLHEEVTAARSLPAYLVESASALPSHTITVSLCEWSTALLFLSSQWPLVWRVLVASLGHIHVLPIQQQRCKLRRLPSNAIRCQHISIRQRLLHRTSYVFGVLHQPFALSRRPLPPNFH